MIKLDPCTELYRSTLILNPNSSVKKDYADYYVGGPETNYKDMYFDLKSKNVSGDLFDAVEGNQLIPGEPYTRIFIAPESKISRDVLRNGGYSITHSREKAQYIVVPMTSNFRTLTCNVLFRRGTQCRLIDIQFPKQPEKDFVNADEKAAILDFIQSWLHYEQGELYHNDGMTKFGISFITKCEDFEDILFEKYTERSYVDETNIIYNTSTDISPETLTVWSKLDDDHLLEKAVVASNYEKYPMTLALFLKNTIGLSPYTFGYQGRVVLNAIDYQLVYRGKADTLRISAEDWNMYQSYLMFKYGVSENGGFSTRKIDREDEPFLRSRMALKPITATETKKMEDFFIEVKK